MIPLFDLHCDTLLKLYYSKLDFNNNTLHINKTDYLNFSPYIQVLAIWSDTNLNNDDAFKQYKDVLSYSRSLGIQFTDSASELRETSFILAVEDARILNGNLSRLDILSNDGVKILTFNWQGASIIGGGWDTDLPLTSFGKDALLKCFDLNIIPDLSHSSNLLARQVLDICKKNGKSVIFSHSNSFFVCNHKRNITDDLFSDVIYTDSLVGLSLVCQHLSNDKCSIDNVIEHIYHFLSLGGENCIALGCDFDGTDSLPVPISSIKDLALLYSSVEKEFGRKTAQKIFFFNAYNFYCKNIN